MHELPQHIHIIGIAGKGMSALALLLRESGCTVTGSDAGAFDPIKGLLEKKNISFAKNYVAENIPAETELIVIGKHAKLVVGNPEVDAAIASGVPITSMAKLLGEITHHRETVVVAGSYGKSTCTTLISFILDHAGKDIGYFIGALPYDFDTHARLGSEKLFIAEGDEYPSANFDTTSKFLYLHPAHLLLTSAEHDHMTVFPTIDDYHEPYKKLLEKMSSHTTVAGCSDNPHVSILLEKSGKQFTTYSLNDTSSWHARNIVYGEITTFDIYKGEEKILSSSTQLLGTYNIQNIIGVVALLIENNLLEPGAISRVLPEFSGVHGRLDKVNNNPVTYEAYGSSYTKAKSAIQAMKLHFPNKKLRIIFEPHTFTWRDPSQRDNYKNVFDDAESVILFPTPGSHGKSSAGQLTMKDIHEAIQTPTTIADDAQDALHLLRVDLSEDDVVLLITSGDMSEIKTGL